MRDIVVLAITAGFFVLCVAYVRWCDHIIGPDPDDVRDDVDSDVDAVAERAPMASVDGDGAEPVGAEAVGS
jgi:hypothetical protein